MKLNQLLLLASLGFGFWSCGETTSEEGSATTTTTNTTVTTNETVQPTGSVTISGNIEGATNETLYLYKYGVTPPLTLDSTVLDASGSFSFSVDQQGYAFAGVGFQENNAALLLVGANDEITLQGPIATWSTDYQVSGTGYSADVRGYLASRQEFTNKINVLKAELAAIPPTDGIAQQAINEKGLALQDEFIAVRDQFILDMDDTPALYIALQDIYDPISDIDKLKTIGKATNKYMPNSIFAEQINTALTQAEQQLAYSEQTASAGVVAIGNPAPELSFPSPDGKMISLSSLKGQVVLLDFWASWCKPCRMENPNVVNLYNQYKDKGFTVYSVSLDNSKSKWVNAIEADGLAWPNHVSDLGGWNAVPAAIYGVNSIPQTYLIGTDGTIIAKDLRGEELASKLKEILG